MQDQKWKKISTEIISELSLTKKKTFQFVDGEKKEFTIATGKDKVVVFGLTNEEKIVIVEQFRVGPEKLLLNLPGGNIEVGETPIIAARRELINETGYSSDDLTLIIKASLSPFSEQYFYFIIASNCHKVAEASFSDMHESSICEITKDEFFDYLMNGNFSTTDIAGGFIGLSFILKKDLE